MSRIRRSVASTPQRTAVETWAKISALLAPDPKSPARTELDKVAGVAASSISSEGPKVDPIIVYDGGPRVHMYCVYGEDAISGDGVEEEAFTTSPVEGDWKISLPVPEEDLGWSQKKLKSISTRAVARPMGEQLEKETASQSAREAEVDLKEFFKS